MAGAVGRPYIAADIMKGIHVILFVRDQHASTRFYAAVLGREPSLDVPGMTEFALPGGLVLGLMPEAGVERLHGAALPASPVAAGVPRCELYLVVDDPQQWHDRALAAGARELSGLQPHDWGDTVAYSLDPDGHMLAFAARLA